CVQRRRPRPTLFPYTTLFRSIRASWAVGSDTERVIDVEDARLSNAAAWLPAGPATARTGFRPASGDPGAVTASGTPDGYVHVSPDRKSTRLNSSHVKISYAVF